MGILLALPVVAQGQGAVVRSDPAVLDIGPGQVAVLTIVLANAQDVYGIDVRAVYDPQLLEVVDANPAQAGIQLTPGTFPRPDFVARNTADNLAGTLRYAVTQVSPTAPASGAGTVFVVQLRARAASGQAAFNLTSVELSDRNGTALPVQPVSGLIRIVPATVIAITATPTPTTPATPVIPTLSPTPVPAVTATAPTASASASPPTLAVPTVTPPSTAVPASSAVAAPPTTVPVATVPALTTAAPALPEPAALATSLQVAAVATGTEVQAVTPAVTVQATRQAGLTHQPSPTPGADMQQTTSRATRSALLLVGMAALAAAAVIALLMLRRRR